MKFKIYRNIQNYDDIILEFKGNYITYKFSYYERSGYLNLWNAMSALETFYEANSRNVDCVRTIPLPISNQCNCWLILTKIKDVQPTILFKAESFLGNYKETIEIDMYEINNLISEWIDSDIREFLIDTFY